MLRKFSTVISSKNFSYPIFFSSSSGTPIIQCWCVRYCPRGLWDYPQFFSFFLLYSALQKLFPPFYLPAYWYILLLQIFCYWFLLEYFYGEGNGTPLQYSCLENPMDGGAWWAAVHEVTRVGHDWATSLSLLTFMHWRRKWQPTPVFLPGESQGWGSLVATVYGVAQSRTRLRWLSSSSSRVLLISVVVLFVFVCLFFKFF